MHDLRRWRNRGEMACLILAWAIFVYVPLFDPGLAEAIWLVFALGMVAAGLLAPMRGVPVAYAVGAAALTGPIAATYLVNRGMTERMSQEIAKGTSETAAGSGPIMTAWRQHREDLARRIAEAEAREAAEREARRRG